MTRSHESQIMTIVIMTFNIRLAVDSSLDDIADTIVESGADVVGLQEVGRHWSMGEWVDMPAYLSCKTGLSHYDFVGAILGPEQCQYGFALLSRYPIIERQVTRLFRREDEPRALLRVVIRPEPNGNSQLRSKRDEPDGAEMRQPDDVQSGGEAVRSLTFLTTHLSFKQYDRQGQVEQLVREAEVAMSAGPAILLGDLNLTHEEQSYHALRAAMCDAHERCALPTFPATKPVQKLDYIFYAGIKCTRAQTGVRIVSDHLPITATFEQPRDWS